MRTCVVQRGGLEGALATRAAEVFGALSPAVQARLPRVFRQLVTISTDENAAPARKPAAVAALKGDAESAAFVDAFVSARLLSTKPGADGTPQAEITHEALLTRWPPLRKWLVANRELLRVRSRVAAAAELWEQYRRPADRLLLIGQPLDEARRLHKAGFELLPREKALITASYRRARRARWARRAGFAALAALALIALVFAFFAESNRRNAEQNFSEARKTVDEFVTEISRDDLAAIPGLQDTRQKFAQKAVERYEEFSLHRPGDPDVRLELANAKTARGMIKGSIGSLEVAQKELEEAIALNERNVREYPLKAEYWLALATARYELGTFMWETGQGEDVPQHAEKVIKVLETLVSLHPDNAEAKYQLARAYNLRGNIGRESGTDLAQAKADYERSRDLFLEVLPVYPRKVDCLTGVAGPLHNRALMFEDDKDYKKALEVFEQSQAFDKQAAVLAPQSPRLLSNLSIGLWSRALLLNQMKRPDDARKAYDESVQLGRAVVRDNPKVTRFRWLLCDSLRQYAAFLSSRKEYEASRKDYEESCQNLEDLTRQVEDRPQYAEALIQSRLALAAFHQGAKGSGAGERDEKAYEKALDEAVETGRRLAAKHPKAPGLNYQFATALARRAERDVEAKEDEKAFPMLQECLKVYDERVWAAGKHKDSSQMSEFLNFATSAINCAKRLKRPEDVIAIKNLAYEIGKECPNREGIQNLQIVLGACGSVHQEAGRNREAIATYQQAIEVSRPVFDKATWHWWLRANLGGDYMHLAELYEKVGDVPNEVHARQEFLRILGGPIDGMKTEGYIDPDPPASEAEAIRLRAFMAKLPGMKQFTIPCDFNGLKYPFQVYVTEVPWPKDPLEDQARWLEEVRGGTIPEEVRESFRKLHKIAHENNVSFQDLCVYALGTTPKDDKK